MTERTAPLSTADLREERKVVTALFADLVGSTALAERLDPEEAKLVVGDAIARIVTEVEKLGGHVKDLAGDGVLAFFGAPVSYEDDAERAVRAGVNIAHAIGDYADEVARSFDVSGFSVRIGICTGPVVLGEIGAGKRVEYAAFGDTVNTAARLQAAADPGRIVVDAATGRLVEPVFELNGPLRLELKGKEEPVEGYEVTRLRPAASRRARGPEWAETSLVGRASELTEARGLLEALWEGRGGALFVTGEAGIGKTRLNQELRAAFEGAESGGAAPMWIEGRCVSYGESLPLWPFRDLLRDWLGVSVDEPELRVRIALRRACEQLFGERTLEIYPYLGSVLGLTLEPDAAARLAQLSPEALQYRTFEVVGSLLERLSDDGPVVVAVEDLHWADPTSVQLTQRLLPLTERAAVLLTVTQRLERDHLSWEVKQTAEREFPHLVKELALEPLTGDADRELLHALVGAGTLPPELEHRVLADAEGNPFYLEELVRSLADAGALVRQDDGWRFDHDVPVEIPPTVEKVILARIDRLDPACHDVLTAAAALGRRFTLALLEGVLEGNGALEDNLHELQRLDLVRTGRRWPQPEYRFKHALIQEAAYRTLVGTKRTALHRKAAEWLEERYAGGEDEVLGELAHHWLAADDEEKAVAFLSRAADRARREWSLDEAIGHYRDLLPLLERRGAQQEMALVLFKLALALHTALRFREANEAFQRAFGLWSPPAAGNATATLRVASDVSIMELDPPRSYRPPDMQLQMALFDRLVERWPEATIVPSLAESWDISDDGLRYVFRLRNGLHWSDGKPLTAQDVEYGIKRSLDPEQPGVSVAIYFVLENGQDYALGHNVDADRIGVRALDEQTLEFRLVAPAPYFLSVVNRPDGGPQPRHAIEANGAGWLDPSLQVVSGAFRQLERSPGRVVLERRPDAPPRAGTVARVDVIQTALDDALEQYARDDVDLVITTPTSQLADRVPVDHEEIELGPPAWTIYLVFDHREALLMDVDLRRALAHAIDRDALSAMFPPNFVPATGGIVPPALQGHTPDIAPRFDPDLARECLRRSGVEGPLTIGATAGDPIGRMVEAVAAGWRAVLGLDIEVRVPDEDFATARMRMLEYAPLAPGAWFPGYPDPEYYLRLLLHSEAKDNRGHWKYAPFDELIERARREPDGRVRLQLFHDADRVAIADQVAVIPLAYGRNAFLVKPWVRGWWEFGKSWSSFADLLVDERSPRFGDRPVS